MEKNHRGFDEPNRKQRLRRQKKLYKNAEGGI